MQRRKKDYYFMENQKGADQISEAELTKTLHRSESVRLSLSPSHFHFKDGASCCNQVIGFSKLSQSVTLHTSHGDLKIEIFCEAVPKTAEVGGDPLCSLAC